MTPGGAADCSAFPAGTREKVAAAWEPVARVYQLFAAFQLNMLPVLVATTGPAAFALGPFIAIGVLSTVFPYVVTELLINCNPSQQLGIQARRAREALDLLDRVPDFAPVPGLAEIKRAVRLARPLLVAAEGQRMPTLANVNDLAKAAGVLDGLDANTIASLESVVSPAMRLLNIQPSSVLPWGDFGIKAALAGTAAASKGTPAQKAAAIAAAKALSAQKMADSKRAAAKKVAIAEAKQRILARNAEARANGTTPQQEAAIAVATVEASKPAGGVPLAVLVPVLGIVANALGVFGKSKGRG